MMDSFAKILNLLDIWRPLIWNDFLRFQPLQPWLETPSFISCSNLHYHPETKTNWHIIRTKIKSLKPSTTLQEGVLQKDISHKLNIVSSNFTKRKNHNLPLQTLRRRKGPLISCYSSAQDWPKPKASSGKCIRRGVRIGNRCRHSTSRKLLPRMEKPKGREKKNLIAWANFC